MILHSDDEFYNEKILQLYADEYLKSGADVLYANGVYVKNQEQRAKNKEQRIKNQEKRAKSKEQRTKSQESRV